LAPRTSSRGMPRRIVTPGCHGPGGVTSYDKSQHIFRGNFLPAFSFDPFPYQLIGLALRSGLREHEANDAYQRPWPKCEPSLKIRFFTVSYSWSGPHGASCEKREPASTIFKTWIPQITPRCTPSFPQPHDLISKTYLLLDYSYPIGRTQDDARSQADDEHSRHRHNCFLLAPARTPDTAELREEDGVLPDRYP